MYSFGVGGQEVKQDASEGIADIPLNRTFLVQKLTNEEPLGPDSVQGLKNVEDVFAHFKPAVEVDLDREDGSTVSEEFRFGNLADFGTKNLVEKSPFLKDLSIQQEQYNKILKQAKSNKILAKVLENPETKSAFMDVLKSLTAELD